MKSLDDPRARRGRAARLTAASALSAAVVLLSPGVMAQDGATITRSTMKIADTPVHLGAPYSVDGVTMTPGDVVDYDDVGRVVILPLGGERVTVRGEPYDGNAMTASHPTLPLPSYVEVTELDGGRTILVRVADRGPGRAGALFGVSPGVARALGLQDGAPVRVRRVNPPEAERALLRNFQAAQERLATPDSLLTVLRKKAATLPAVGTGTPSQVASTAPATPAPAAKATAKSAAKAKPAAKTASTPVTKHVGVVPSAPPPKPVAKPTAEAVPVTDAMPQAENLPVMASPTNRQGYVVQLGAFANKASAETIARHNGGSVSAKGRLWRVRVGPYPTEAAARKACENLVKKGVDVARVMRADS